jgi:6-phosphogluconolactonase (cycloisomerase 2 family)
MMGLLRRVAAALGLVALCWTTGCAGFWVYPGSSSGSSTSTSSSVNYVYVANATAATLSGFAVGTGTLTAVTGSPYALPFYPTAVAVNPANSIVFVAGNSEIYSYTINSGGSLSLLNTNPLVVADVVAMDISPDGQWLLALDGNRVTVDEFQITSSSGVLTQGAGASYSTTVTGFLPMAIKVALLPNGSEYVFVALGTAGDLVYPFNTSTGVLSTPLPLSLGAGSVNSDDALAVNANTSTLYIARTNSSSAGSIVAYSIGGGGALNQVAQGTTGVQPYSVVLNTAGTDVYVANRTDGTISEFSTTANSSQLPALGTITSGTAVTALTVDSSGDYLLAANSGANDLTMFSFDSMTPGTLDYLNEFATGTEPDAIAATH